MTILIFWAMPTAVMAYGFVRARTYGRIRLDEKGVWPNRKGQPKFVAWSGAQVAVKGFLLLVKNGQDIAEINMASFCRQRPLRTFINRKFPRKELVG